MQSFIAFVSDNAAAYKHNQDQLQRFTPLTMAGMPRGRTPPSQDTSIPAIKSEPPNDEFPIDGWKLEDRESSTTTTAQAAYPESSLALPVVTSESPAVDHCHDPSFIPPEAPDTAPMAVSA